MDAAPVILVADDHAGFLEALTIRLRAHGYEVIAATDGDIALACAVERTPDLLLLDVHMPAGDAFAQARRDRSTGLEGIPVIYLTGDTSDETIALAAERGAVALLKKPVEMKALLDLIARTVASPAT